MYIHRWLQAELAEWRADPRRKPLVLRGARQTGKSTLVREFGRGYAAYVELNLERRSAAILVEDSETLDDFLLAIRLRENLAAFPKSTLLFFDEIQVAPKLIGWLRFLHEDHPDLHVIAAGSHLDRRLRDRGFDFPVGRVTFRTLRPLSFREFLAAVGREVLATELTAIVEEGRPPADPVHAEALERYREYLLIGGMPEAVARWTERRDLVEVRGYHADLWQALLEDVPRYDASRSTMLVLERLHHHYGQRFKYGTIVPGERTDTMRRAIDSLEASMLVSRVRPTSSVVSPFVERPRIASKLVPLDVGLALYTMSAGLEELTALPIEDLVDGRRAEMAVGQMLLAGRTRAPDPLFYWVREDRRATAEIDYLLPCGDGTVLPVEVKAGPTGRLRSLHYFMSESGCTTAIRVHAGAFLDQQLTVRLDDGDLRYRLISLPAYLAGWIRDGTTSSPV